ELEAHRTFDALHGPVEVETLERMHAGGEVAYGARDAQLGEEERLEIKPRFAPVRLAHQLVLAPARLDPLRDDLRGDVGHRRRLGDDGPFGIADVPGLLAQLLESEAEGRAGAQGGVTVDAEALGEFIRSVEADSPDVGGESVRVLLHDRH